MPKLRVFEHTSLDGVIEPGAPGDYSEEFAKGSWMAPYRSVDGFAAVLEAQGADFDLLLGRRTYDLWSGYWPKAPSSSMADRLNAATKYVATKRPDSLEWGPAKDLGTDIVGRVRTLKNEGAADFIVWGSATLTHILFDEGLVDEVVLCVYPLFFGQGKRFYSESAKPSEFALISSNATSSGVLINTFQRVGLLQNG